MSRQFHIVPIHREPPDLDRFVAALLALALARVEAERADAAGRTAAPGERKGSDE